MKKRKKSLLCGAAAFAVIMQMPGITVLAHAQSLGEKMRTAAFNTVLGIGTVFIMLILMAFIIYAFRIIPKIQNKFTKKEEPMEQSVETPVLRQPAAVTDETDDLELVAVIAAAIASYEQVPMDSFRVRTIKKRH